MLREFQVTMNKPANAQYKAGQAGIKTGMAVVKDEANGTFVLPTAATSKNIYFVDKERIAKGVNAAYKDLSDYHEDFVNVEDGELAKVIAYYPGEVIGTDQADTTTLAVGDYLEANEKGQMVKATGETKYVYIGEYNDNGHKLAKIKIGE